MINNKIVDYVNKNKRFFDKCLKLSNYDSILAEEMYQELWLILLSEKNVNKLNEAYYKNPIIYQDINDDNNIRKEIDLMIMSIINNMGASKTSPFYYKFKKNGMTKDSLDKIPTLIDNCYEDKIKVIEDGLMDEEYKKLFEAISAYIILKINSNTKTNYYHFTLLKMYVIDNMTYRDISKQTGINLSTVFFAIKKSKDELILKFKDRYDNIEQLLKNDIYLYDNDDINDNE